MSCNFCLSMVYVSMYICSHVCVYNIPYKDISWLLLYFTIVISYSRWNDLNSLGITHQNTNNWVIEVAEYIITRYRNRCREYFNVYDDWLIYYYNVYKLFILTYFLLLIDEWGNRTNSNDTYYRSLKCNLAIGYFRSNNRCFNFCFLHRMLLLCCE